MTQWLWHNLQQGMEIEASPPQGSFILDSAPAPTYCPQLSHPADDWGGGRGRIDAVQIVHVLGGTTGRFYLCAGNAVMDALQAGLVGQGVAAAAIHREAFGAAGGARLSGLRLAVEQGGRQQIFATAGEPTLLAALEANAVPLPSECRAGSCGQCTQRLAEGEVAWLAQPEQPIADCEILPCVCTARSDVRLTMP